MNCQKVEKPCNCEQAMALTEAIKKIFRGIMAFRENAKADVEVVAFGAEPEIKVEMLNWNIVTDPIREALELVEGYDSYRARKAMARWGDE